MVEALLCQFGSFRMWDLLGQTSLAENLCRDQFLGLEFTSASRVSGSEVAKLGRLHRLNKIPDITVFDCDAAQDTVRRRATVVSALVNEQEMGHFLPYYADDRIELVLIDTQAHKAIDVFYVTAEGCKLDAAREAALGESLLAVCQPAG